MFFLTLTSLFGLIKLHSTLLLVIVRPFGLLLFFPTLRMQSSAGHFEGSACDSNFSNGPWEITFVFGYTRHMLLTAVKSLTGGKSNVFC